jgi:D-alanyl-D-alanine carboxypeptidase
MLCAGAAWLMLGLSAVSAGAQLSADTQAQIAAAAEKALTETGVPSASVGVVVGGRIVYTQAFGLAHLRPDVKASAGMAYPIGSISKQFTAAAMLLLEQDGRLSIDDKVAKYFPELTRAKDISIRNLLTMTSGYEDYAPQDYTVPAWLKPVDPLALVRQWAGKPLDFEPGTQWQYSNTNYVLAALIIQKVTGEPLMQFLRERVLGPLRLEGVVNTYTEREKLRVTGYVSNAMAPVREEPLEAEGWYLGDGDLAMPASTLLQWDVSILHEALLKPESYREMETPFVLKNGTDTHYGLGIDVRMRNGHRALEHSGEVGGFVAENVVYPEEKAAVAVLTNEVASSAAREIADSVSALVLAKPATGALEADAFAPRLGQILAGLQHGKIDRSLFTADCNAYFDQDVLDDFALTLGRLGTITGVSKVRTALRGGMTFELYHVAYSQGTTIIVSLYLEPDGRIEQLLVEGKA